MVIEDTHLIKKKNQKTENSKDIFNLADPIDRAAAFIVDGFIVLMPILLLLNAPFKRMFYSSVILDDNTDLMFSVVYGIIVNLFVITFYSTIFTALFGGTLGKKFLGLEVLNVWTRKRPSFSSSLLRSFSWWLGLITLGFSFLSMYSNSLRRTLHDRISETMVVNNRNKKVSAPTIYEASIVKGIFVGFVGFIFILLFFLIHNSYKSINISSRFTQMLEEKGNLCQRVGDEIERYNSNNLETIRLELAMALYAAGVIDESCLDLEANYLFKQDKIFPIVYLAKSFVHSDRAKLSNSYLERVCSLDKNSKECLMSNIVELWDKEEWNLINEKFQNVDSNWPLYIKIWAIRNSVKQGDMEFAQKLISEIPELYSFKKFIVEFKAKIYYNTNNNENNNAYMDLALSMLQEEEKTHLSTWLCYQKVSKECSQSKQSVCDNVKNESSGESEESGLKSLTHLRINWCDGFKAVNSNRFNREVEKLQQALKTLLVDRKKGEDILWSIYKGKEYKDEVREEAVRYLIESTSSESSLQKLIIFWKNKPHMLEWKNTGELLFYKLLTINLHSSAADVGDELSNHFKLNSEFQRNLAVTFYKTGERKKAWDLINTNNSNLSRRPANVSKDFEFIKEDLIKEFKTK
jgi:uncharacterized RDD family membrane protein YckC